MAVAGLAASLMLYDSRFVRAGAIGAVLLAGIRLLWPHRLAPGPPLPELLLLLMPLSFILGQEFLASRGLPLYDQYLYQLDAWLGQPGFAAVGVAVGNPARRGAGERRGANRRSQ